ncbi:hypothetical protein BBF96_12340 [Anoxybacter fermentans]|uniref:Uncharacterized protein n=1 Tax=Anoxybacter fermentans TaxID=1323375 RepID=A0A3Q9HRI6_9FIRM|nr:secretin N-terminal domain-containing protein [Anoxybacter fermentans]AZR74118.1 hypothetical protein BBF96_12340 [Anoxybacter fermentans]
MIRKTWIILIVMVIGLSNPGMTQEEMNILSFDVIYLNSLTQIVIQTDKVLDYRLREGDGVVEVYLKGQLAKGFAIPENLTDPIKEVVVQEKMDGVIFYVKYSDSVILRSSLTPDQKSIVLSLSSIKDEETRADKKYKVFFLEYADLKEVANILKKMIPFGDRAIQINEEQQALIISREVEDLDEIEKLIKELDFPREQILIDAKIIEINVDDNSTLGLDFSDSFGVMFKEKTSTYGEVDLNLQTFVRTPLNLMAAINLLKGKGQARVLANPRIATVSGVEAKVITQERIPIFISENVSGQNYRIKQDIVAGIQLKIKPRVNKYGEIISEIYTNVTSVTGTTADGYPTTSSREAETIIRCKAGETIVIGGLARESVIQYENRIPLLGDIPILGRLFRTVRDETKRSDLYIFITPYLVNHKDVLNVTLPSVSESVETGQDDETGQ